MAKHIVYSSSLRGGVVAPALVVLATMMLQAEAAPPQIAKIAMPTLQPGAGTTLVIDGTDLSPTSRILLPIPILKQTVTPGKTANQILVEIQLENTVPPGVYQLRIGNEKGISNAVGVEIDDFPQLPIGSLVDKLPATLHGTLVASATVQTVFAGKKGQKVVIEVEARRLGSAINPVVRLFDAKRLQLAWASGSSVLADDARLTVVLPADGPYTVELHDGQYKAGTPNRFRLKIGDYGYADLAFPLAAQRGTKATFQLIGNVPDSTRVEADLTTASTLLPYTLPRVAGVRGPMPRILVSDSPEILETDPPPGKLQETAVPVGINGRIGKAKEVDRYRLLVQPAVKLKFDLFAERAGSPLDAVLTLTNEAGTVLARSDDQPNTVDPGLEFTVPAGVTALVASITDVHGRGGADYIYRLAVTPAGQPDFSLALFEDRQQIPRGGAAVMRVRATRAGYTGPIKLALPGLPEGVVVTGDDIPAGTPDTLLTLAAPEGTKFGQAVIMIVGEGMEAGQTLRRLALPPETPFTRTQVWLRGELGVAVTEPAPFTVAWEPPEANLPIGANPAVKVKVTRGPDLKGPVRLALVTSQVIPKTKDNKDDVNRAIRVEGMPLLAADQGETTLKILVPGDLPVLPYDLAIRAELLGADNKTVLATATTPGKRLLAGK